MSEATKKNPQKQFGDLLMSCFSLDVQRRGSTNEDIHKFVRQAIKDSGHILQGTIPSDIMEQARRRATQ
jgi:hypothetical protein